MCVTPLHLKTKSGLAVEAACRKCWQCVENQKNDWVGRNIAEMQDAGRVTVNHLTYGGDDRVTGEKTDLGASILIYADVRKWLMRLRSGRVDKASGERIKYPLRFFAVGEYGELKGRSHWHVICYWQKQIDKDGRPFVNVPAFDEYRNFNDEWWPHGFTLTEDVRDGGQEKAIRYVCKYLQKADGGQSLMRMSKTPPLGGYYFRRLADTYARQGILPKDAFYSFPEILDTKGLPRKFMMQGVTLDNFCSDFIQAWKVRYGSHPLDVQHSEFLQSWCDAVAARPVSEGLDRRKMGGAPRVAPEAPHFGFRVHWHEPVNSWVADRGLERLYWSFDEKGERSWQDVIVTESQAASRRRRSAILRDADAYRSGRDGR